MPVQKELSDLEHGPASGAGGEIDLHPPPLTPMEGKRGEDHVLDFNVANFSTPAGKQILHDVGTWRCLVAVAGGKKGEKNSIKRNGTWKWVSAG